MPVDTCSSCHRMMAIQHKGQQLCCTCYRQSRARRCAGCGRLARMQSAGLCWTCVHQPGPHELARLPQFGPREHHMLRPAAARLSSAERAALADVFRVLR